MKCLDRSTCRVWVAAVLAARRARLEYALARKNTKAPVAAGAGKENE